MLYDPKWEITVAPVETWRATLLKAADLIRERGLAKYTQQDKNRSVCIQGAISIALSGRVHCDNAEYCEATKILGRYLVARGERGASEKGNAYWNNTPERTADEVIAALEGAARS